MPQSGFFFLYRETVKPKVLKKITSLPCTTNRLQFLVQVQRDKETKIFLYADIKVKAGNRLNNWQKKKKKINPCAFNDATHRTSFAFSSFPAKKITTAAQHLKQCVNTSSIKITF